MNILVPTSWLREYLKTDASAKKIAELLSLHGQSVERIQKVGKDFIFDVEVTTNRPDAASIYGLAREANAILNFNGIKSSLIGPKGITTSLEPDIKEKLNLEVIIKNNSLCPRFTAIILENVKIKPSPAIIRNRLEACGIRAINNIVDITNYVMLELGQPMHAFDFDKIKSAKMYLRESQKGESLKTLDGQNRKIPQGAIVISDSERLIDLCGIMGAQNSQITTRTKRVIVFVQSYDPVRIRRTTQALALRTEAASRFEKGVDIQKIDEALKEAVSLAKKNSGAKIASELIDIYKNPLKSKTISLTKSRLDDYLGIDLPMEKSVQILKLLGFTAKGDAQTISAIAPSWRNADMEIPEDLIEEIARVYGYHNLPSSLTSGNQPQEFSESDLARVISLKKALKYLGLSEVMSYSIISEEFLKLTGVKKEEAVELANPLSSEWQFMRPTQIVSLAAIIAQNQNLKNNLKIYEVAKTYVPARHSDTLLSLSEPFDVIASPAKQSQGKFREESLPIQDLHLSIALQNSDFYQIKGIVENVFEIVGREVEFKKSDNHQTLYLPQTCSDVISGSKLVGTLGILDSKIQNHFALVGTTAVAEINLTTTYNLQPTTKSYRPIAKFPPIIEDISAIFNSQTPIAEIIKTVKAAGLPLLRHIEIMDIYRDEKIGTGKKSVTLHLTYQKSTSTPTQLEVNAIRNKIISTIEQKLQGTVRM